MFNKLPKDLVIFGIKASLSGNLSSSQSTKYLLHNSQCELINKTSNKPIRFMAAIWAYLFD